MKSFDVRRYFWYNVKLKKMCSQYNFSYVKKWFIKEKLALYTLLIHVDATTSVEDNLATSSKVI